jgi:hypothetical protein
MLQEKKTAIHNIDYSNLIITDDKDKDKDKDHDPPKRREASVYARLSFIS